MRQISRSKKAFLNTIVLAINEIVAFVCQLILPRWILLYFGSTYNGISSSISQFLSFISVLLIGIAGSTRFALYKVLADEDREGISGIVNATERYMRKVGAVLLGYIAVLSVAYPYIAQSDLPKEAISTLVVIIGASSFAQYFFGTSSQILLTADQRQYVYYILQTGATVLSTALAVLLMASGQDVFIVKIGSALVFIALPIALNLIVKRNYQIDKKVPSNPVGLKGRWDVMWHSIANIVHDNTDLVVLTVFADVKLVSVYTVHYLVINGLFKVLSIFTRSLEAAFGSLFANKEEKKAYHHLGNYEFFMAVAVSVIFSCALVLIEPFVRLYTAGVTDVDYSVPAFAYIAVIAQIVMCLRQPYVTVVQAAGHYKQTRNGAFAEAAINIVLSVVLTYRLGIVGVALGTLIANVFRTAQYVLYLRKNILNRSVLMAIKTILWVAANMVVIIGLSKGIMLLITINSWITWIVCGTVCFVVACVVILFSAMLFCKSRFVETYSIVKHMVLRGR